METSQVLSKFTLKLPTHQLWMFCILALWLGLFLFFRGTYLYRILYSCSSWTYTISIPFTELFNSLESGSICPAQKEGIFIENEEVFTEEVDYRSGKLLN